MLCRLLACSTQPSEQFAKWRFHPMPDLFDIFHRDIFHGRLAEIRYGGFRQACRYAHTQRAGDQLQHCPTTGRIE